MPQRSFTDEYLISAYVLPLDIARKNADYINRHVMAVIKCGLELDVSLEQLLHHDESKWSREEFPGYARCFFGNDECPKDPVLFHRAWNHHIHNNPHHPEYWELTGGSFLPGDGEIEGNILVMPEEYVREMIADWQGASLAITGSKDMTNWLQVNLRKKRLHSQSRTLAYKLLDELGYGEITKYLVKKDAKV